MHIEEGRRAAVLCDNVVEEKPRSAAGLFGPEGGAPRVLRLVLCVRYAFLFAPDSHTELREKDPLSASGERVGKLAHAMFRSRATASYVARQRQGRLGKTVLCAASRPHRAVFVPARRCLMSITRVDFVDQNIGTTTHGASASWEPAKVVATLSRKLRDQDLGQTGQECRAAHQADRSETTEDFV